MNAEKEQPNTAVGMELDHADTNPTIDLAKRTIAGKVADLMHPDNAPDQTQPLWERYPDLCINPFKELPPVQTWCNMGERKAIPKEGIITFQAKQKQGKSLSTYAFAIPLLSGLDFGTIHPVDRPNYIVVFDMEMGETTLTNRVKNQVQTIGNYGNRFGVFNLKGKSIEDRIKTINDIVAEVNPQIIVIDQVGKLVMDGNNVAESNTITDMLDKLSIGRSVWCVMHENKDNEFMRGHLGSYLSFANVESYAVEKKHGVYTITYKEGRDTDAENAATFQFILDPNGNIADGAERAKQVQDTERAKWLENARNIFGTDKLLRRFEIINRIETKEGLNKDGATNKVKKLASIGVIQKTGTDTNAPYAIVENGY